MFSRMICCCPFTSPRSTTSDPYAAGDFDYLHLGADVCVKYAGFSLVSEVMYRDADADRRTVMEDDEAITIASRSGWGVFAQAGQMVTKHMEVSARYGHLQPKRGTDPQLVRSEELGGALSYYFMGHDLKYGPKGASVQLRGITSNHPTTSPILWGAEAERFFVSLGGRE